jgi:hypothetical protein
MPAIELQETRNESWSDGKITASRRFAVWNDSTPLTSAAAVRALFGTTVDGVDLPDVGSQFPGDAALYAKSYALKPERESRGVWMIDFTYENSEPLDKQPNEIGYTQFTVNWSAEFRDLWRVNPGLAIPQYGSASETADCAGKAIDVAGEPMTVLQYFGSIEFTETVSLSSLPDRSQLIRVARGKRNLTDFQGAPIGQVLYKGASANRIGVDTVSLTHTFSQDALMHLIQRPDKKANGDPMLTLDTNGVFRASMVRFVQPFPEFANFNLLSENF